MINSLLFALQNERMPFILNDPVQANAILKLLPEIKDYYGDDVNATLAITLAPKSERPIILQHGKGITIGEDASVELTLAILATTDALERDPACEFKFNIVLPINFSL